MNKWWCYFFTCQNCTCMFTRSQNVTGHGCVFVRFTIGGWRNHPTGNVLLWLKSPSSRCPLTGSRLLYSWLELGYILPVGHGALKLSNDTSLELFILSIDDNHGYAKEAHGCEILTTGKKCSMTCDDKVHILYVSALSSTSHRLSSKSHTPFFQSSWHPHGKKEQNPITWQRMVTVCVEEKMKFKRDSASSPSQNGSCFILPSLTSMSSQDL